jgi:hypothetical protein
VAETTRSASVSLRHSEFDEFLFASVGEDGNGMLLSVVSALARLDVDPWQEAAKLAGLPGETATERLASLLAALPDRGSAQRDPGTIAARLVALLPSQASSKIAVREALLSAGAVTSFWAVIYVIFMAFVLSAQFIVTRHQLAAQVDSAEAPASSTVFTTMPPPSSSQR